MEGALGGVAYSDASPRHYEIALSLCGGCVRLLSEHWASHPEEGDAVFAWYLRKIAFLHHADVSLSPLRAQLSERTAATRLSRRYEAAEMSVRAALLDGPQDEVDFFAAAQQIPSGLQRGGLDLGGVEKSLMAGDRNGLTQGVPGAPHSQLLFDLHTATWTHASIVSQTPSWDSTIPADDGFALVVQFLSLCYQLSGDSSVAAAAVLAFRQLLRQLQASEEPDVKSVGAVMDDIRVDTATMNSVLVMDEELELDPVSALGHATKSFNSLMLIAWACASFEHQTALANAVDSWVRTLSGALRNPDEFAVFLQQCPSAYPRSTRPAARPSDSPGPRPPLTAAEREYTDEELGGAAGGAVVNLTRAHELLRSVFEGHAADADQFSAPGPDEEGDGGGHGKSQCDTAFSRLEQFCQMARPTSLADNYVARLLAMQGPSGSSHVPYRELTSQGTKPILRSITTGMLMYVQFYLSTHSLRVARECAAMGVLVGHQLRHNPTLALAHYSSFVVHMASGLPRKAADSVTIALQLSASSAPGSPATDGLASVQGMCYAGAAQLLLFFPSAVNTTLRLLLTSDSASLEPRLPTTGEVGDDADQQAPGMADGPAAAGGAGDPSAKLLYDASEAQTQTVAQTVRNALYLSSEASPQVSGGTAGESVGTFWIDEVAAVVRQTILTAASLYGVASYPQPVDHAVVHDLLRRTRDEEEVRSPQQILRPPATLLSELARYTAHKALAMVDGRLSRGSLLKVCSSAPATATHAHGAEASALEELDSFLQAVGRHYGPSGHSMLAHHSFFSCVTHFVILCAIDAQGFAQTAANGLSRLAQRLYRLSGMTETLAGSPLPTGDSTQADVAFRSEEERLLAVLQATAVGSTAASADETPTWFWPPDLLLLFAQTQLRRARLAAYLGQLDDVDTIAALLAAVSTRCEFVYGVLVSRLIRLLSLHRRMSYHTVSTEAESLQRSVSAIGLESLLFPIAAQQAASLMAAERWGDALQLLEAMARRAMVPPASRLWFLCARLVSGCALARVLCSTSGAGEGSLSRAERREAMNAYVQSGVRELVAYGALAAGQSCSAETETGGAASLQESVYVYASLLQIASTVDLSRVLDVDFLRARAADQTMTLARRQRATHAANAVLPGMLSDIWSGRDASWKVL